MANQARVQEYLARHRVGVMFEDLMAKLISDMPEDPVPYLVHILDRKHKRNSSPVRRSAGEPMRSRAGASPDPVRRTAPASAWASGGARKSVNLDDIWDGGHKAGRGRGDRSPTKMGWGTDTDDEELLYSSFGYRGPRRRPRTDVDPLAGELTVIREKGTPSVRSAPPSTRRRPMTQREAADQHKRQLEKWIMDTQRQAYDSGFEDSKELEPDYADELMEDPELLRSEGVRNAKRSGVRMSRSYRKKMSGEDGVKVSICARCASVMTGGPVRSQQAEEYVPPIRISGSQYDELPSYDYDSDQYFKASRPQSAVVSNFSPGQSDEEFESVSQVTGPRRPVWTTEDSEDELRTSKGTHMFSSRNVPTKGRPMYSARSARSARKERPAPDTRRTYDAMPMESHRSTREEEDVRKTWQAGTSQYPDSEDDDYFRLADPPREVSFHPDTPRDKDGHMTNRTVEQQLEEEEEDSLGLTGRGWAQPIDDFETEVSSYNWREGGRDMSGPY